MKTITLCGSVTAYKQVIAVMHQLKKMGFGVLVPDLAEKMEKEGNYTFGGEVAAVKTRAIRNHFKKIARSDLVLVVNEPKNGIDGYIGPNVLMEMGLAFYLKRPIYLMNALNLKSLVKEEVEALGAVTLNGDLERLREILQT